MKQFQPVGAYKVEGSYMLGSTVIEASQVIIIIIIDFAWSIVQNVHPHTSNNSGRRGNAIAWEGKFMTTYKSRT